MKITANRVKQIIREEYRRMNEADGPRVVDVKITPDQLESQLPDGSGSRPRGEFGEAFAKLLGLELADISEVYLIDSPKFQGLVVTQGGEQIRLRLRRAPTPVSPEDDEGALQRARELKKVARQLQAMEREPDVRESIEEQRAGVATGKLSDLQRMAAANPGATAAQLAGRESADDQSELQKKAMQIFRNLSGVQQNERDIVELLLNLIELAKSENINQQELRRRLGLAKDAAEKIAR
jgi:hypothetical protein